MRLPIVAIIGRPNVGKSTLFNRIIRKPLAITDDRPGVTRDRNAVEFEWNGRPFMLVDTGGYVVGSDDTMEQAVAEQSRIAINEADVIILLVDVKSGITDFDSNVKTEILKSKKPFILTVNKVDSVHSENDVFEFYNLGVGTPMSVSGRTGRGTGDLLDEIVKLLPEEEPLDERETPVRIALMGRPNVGKSSLVNSLVGENRVIVSDTPGTTRDTTDTFLEYQGKEIILVDTAGLKRLTKLHESLEYYSYLRTQTGIARCDVAVAVIDAVDGLTSYEKNIIDDVVQKGKGLIIVVNKWDLIEKDDKTMKEFEQTINDELPDKSYYPIIFTSALTGKRVSKILEMAIKIHESRKLRVRTAELNKFFEKLPIPPGAGDFSILYGTQHSIEPPSFAVFVSDKRSIKENFIRYLEKNLRKEFEFVGTPIEITFKGRERKER